MLGTANQLRVHVWGVFPALVRLFAVLDSAVGRILERFPTQASADWLSARRLAGWLSKTGYSGRVDTSVRHQSSIDASRGRVPTADSPSCRAGVAFNQALPDAA